MNNARRLAIVTSALVVVVGLLLVAFLWSMDHTGYRVWGGFLVVPVVLIVLGYFSVRTAKRLGDPWLTRLLLVALVAKLIASVVRYSVAFGLYNGIADAAGYDGVGAKLAHDFHHNIWHVPNGTLVGRKFMQVVTASVYYVTGHTMLGGFFVFAAFGFIGLYLFYRAFCIGCPDGDRRRYALLVFFLPSLLFWPSSIGKESWMILTLGVTVYGVAKILDRQFSGYFWLALGMAGTAMVRPHISAIVGISLVVAYVLRRGHDRHGRRKRVNIVGLVIVLGVSFLVLRQTQSYLGVDNFSTEGVNKALSGAQAQTAKGGSAFSAVTVKSPAQLPMGIVTVLFRPLPFEAHNLQALVSSLEGGALLVLFYRSRRRFKGLGSRLIRQPYITFCCIYTTLFVVAFSHFSNFGILVRERVQVYPMVLVLLALPLVPKPGRALRASPFAAGAPESDASETDKQLEQSGVVT